jgi:hypothetical protein
MFILLNFKVSDKMVELTTVVKERSDHLQCIFKESERKKINDLSRGDIILFEIKDRVLIKKLNRDFGITLPKSLGLKHFSPASLEILNHIKPLEGLERPVEPFLENETVDIKHFIPLKSNTGKDIFVIDDQQMIFAWFPVGGGVNMLTLIVLLTRRVFSN